MAREPSTQPRLIGESTSQSSPISSSSSYVYPVRSLLSGRIQPAANRQTQSSLSRTPSVSDSDDSLTSTAFKANQAIGGEDASQVLVVAPSRKPGRNSTELESKAIGNVHIQASGHARAELVSPYQTWTRKGMQSAIRNN